MTLKEFRESQGLTQERLANILGVSRQTVSGWENGRMRFSNRSKRDLKAVGYDVEANNEKD